MSTQPTKGLLERSGHKATFWAILAGLAANYVCDKLGVTDVETRAAAMAIATGIAGYVRTWIEQRIAPSMKAPVPAPEESA